MLEIRPLDKDVKMDKDFKPELTDIKMGYNDTRHEKYIMP